jgi:predicted GNAT family N-acyltransferase
LPPNSIIFPMSDPSVIQIRPASIQEILDLRWRILRAGLGREAANFDGDDEPTTLHFAAVADVAIVGCVTILHRPWEDQPAWQLRGMAVEPALQRGGVGGRLLAIVETAVRAVPHSLQLWCNARTPATGFYRKHGWQLVGNEFEIPTAGPHVKMTKRLIV